MTERDQDRETSSRIKVTDRRLFDDSGERRAEVDPRPDEAETATASPEEGDPRPEAPEDEASSAPPVSYPTGFRALTMPFFVEALIHLGLEPHPETGERQVNLDAARVPIELLTLLEEKTRGNLNEQEADELKEILYQVRMMYVEQSSGPKGG